jgi:ABC-type multidrug transport system ATPase subunit
MLSMEAPMSGPSEALIMNKETTEFDLKEKGHEVGLCPQHDAINDNLTVLENLVFMARLKGLNKNEYNNNCTMLLQNLEMTPYTDVEAKKLSKANKRKLSFAMAVIVSPKVGFLDQPMTGVDPCSQRGLLKMIRNLQ